MLMCLPLLWRRGSFSIQKRQQCRLNFDALVVQAPRAKKKPRYYCSRNSSLLARSATRPTSKNLRNSLSPSTLKGTKQTPFCLDIKDHIPNHAQNNGRRTTLLIGSPGRKVTTATPPHATSHPPTKKKNMDLQIWYGGIDNMYQVEVSNFDSNAACSRSSHRTLIYSRLIPCSPPPTPPPSAPPPPRPPRQPPPPPQCGSPGTPDGRAGHDSCHQNPPGVQGPCAGRPSSGVPSPGRLQQEARRERRPDGLRQSGASGEVRPGEPKDRMLSSRRAGVGTPFNPFRTAVPFWGQTT